MDIGESKKMKGNASLYHKNDFFEHTLHSGKERVNDIINLNK